MPKNFKTNKRLLTEDEKYGRAIFFYTYDSPSFKVVYKDPNNIFDQYGQPLLDIEANFNKLDNKTKTKVLDFVEQEIYDETITMKCLNCNHESEEDWEMIEEMWDEYHEPYPTLYCPNCNKQKFVPIDIYNKKKNN